MSNTGFKTQESHSQTKPGGVEFHLDYLTLTLFHGDPAGVELLAAELASMLNRHWSRCSPMKDCAWADHGAGGLWSHLLAGPAGVMLKIPKDPKAGWLQVEMKGEAFTWLTSEDLSAFLADLALLKAHGMVQRWHATRVDFAFDHVPFGPVFVDEARRAGAVRSRVHPLPKNLLEDGLGHHTLYIGAKKQTRLLRLYDLRGFNRLELELRDQHAKETFAELESADPSAWGKIALARVRGFCDFVDPDSATRPENCKLLPWWEDLVGDVASARLKPRQRVDVSSTPAGKINMKMTRFRRDFFLLREALGQDGLMRVVNHLANEYGKKVEGDKGQQAVDLSDVANLHLWRAFIDGYGDPSEVDPDQAPDFLASINPPSSVEFKPSPPPSRREDLLF